MDSIVKHLRENRISKNMQTITKNRANLLGALYEAREYYKTGNSNRFCLALLEKLEKNPNANINRLIASIPYDNHEGVLTESPFPELQYIKLDRDKRNGTEYIEVQIGNNIYRYIYKGDSDASHDTKWAYEKAMSIYKYSPGKAYAWLKPKCILYYNGRTNTHPYNNSLPKLKEDTFVTLNVMKNGKLTSGRLYSNKRLIIEDEVFSLDCQDIDFINRTTEYRTIPLDYDALVRVVSTVTGSGFMEESKKLKESRSDLEKELRRVQSGSNNEFVRKYNLSLSDIRELQGIIFSKEKETINSNVVKVLNDYGIKTRVRGIGWVVESIQSDAEKKRKTRKDTGNLIYNIPSDVDTHHEETDVDAEVAISESVETDVIDIFNNSKKSIASVKLDGKGNILNNGKVVGKYKIEEKPTVIFLFISNVDSHILSDIHIRAMETSKKIGKRVMTPNLRESKNLKESPDNKSGYSKVYKFKRRSFRYNYGTSSLQWIYGTEVVDEVGLSRDNWEDNPKYWVEKYYDDIEEELSNISL